MNRTHSAQTQAQAKPTGKVDQQGFTLIELLIAVTIFTIISASIFGLLEVGRRSRSQASTRTDVMKNARYALNLIGRDALNAGLEFAYSGAIVPDNFIAAQLGLDPDTDTDRDKLFAVIVGNDVFANNLSGNNTKTDTVAFAYADRDFNRDANGIIKQFDISGAEKSSTPANIRVSVKSPGNAAACRANDLYLISLDNTALGVMLGAAPGTQSSFELSPDDPLGMNQSGNGSKNGTSELSNKSATPMTMTRFIWVSYHVAADGTLIRTNRGNNPGGTTASDQIIEEPIAYNVENLQMRYVLKDGTVSDNPVDTNSIRLIQVTVVVRSMADRNAPGGSSRITLSSSFSTRNLEYIDPN